MRHALAYNCKELTYEKPLNSDPGTKPRGREGFIVMEGLEESGKSGWRSVKDNMMYFTSLKHGKLCQSKSMGSQFVRNSACLVPVNNFIFVFAADNESFRPVAMRYDIHKDEWLSPKQPPYYGRATVGSAVARLGSDIYLIGGMYVTQESTFRSHTECSKKVYKYRISTNQWEEVMDIPTGSYYSAATGCEPNQCIYVCGGRPVPDKILNTMYAYDAQANSWLTKPPMKCKRYAHCVALVKNTVFVIGGYEARGQIEMFNTVSEQWTCIQGIPLDVIGSCAIVKDNSMFILGGKCHGIMTADIRVLDTESQQLSLHGTSLPEPMWCPIGGLFVIPSLL